MEVTATQDKGRIKFNKESTHFGYIKGTTMWAKVLAPGEYSSYEVDLYPSDEDLEHFKTIAGEITEGAKGAVEGLGKKVAGIADFVKDKDGKEFIKFKLPETKFDGSAQKPTIFNAGGDETPDWNELIGNGSVVKVKYWISPYYMASSKAVGVSVKFNAVQVISLSKYEGGGQSGFGDETGDGAFGGEQPAVTASEDF